MNILVIKQTSLGDVLHSTGHIRALKTQFPNSHLTLLTASTSAEIFINNPYVDEIICFERYAVKQKWLSNPSWVFSHFREVIRQVRNRNYDLAIDLQGRWKSVLFLYLCKASHKYVKGRWLGVHRFRDRSLHALSEMDQVLKLAKVDTSDTSMEFFSADDVNASVNSRLVKSGYKNQPIVLISPFTRWQSKNWSLKNYEELIHRLPTGVVPVITGSVSDASKVELLVGSSTNSLLINFCGELGLQEFAELVRKAAVVVSGDSFAMHLAVACHTPVIALFGPTDELKVGPGNPRDKVLRSKKECRRCYDRVCKRQCIDAISAEQVCTEVQTILATPIVP